MKLTAFTCGRPGGNCEIYCKEALMAAEAKGVEIELIRLTDCDLHNCRDCSPFFCPAADDVNKCPYGKDDAMWLIDKFLDSDGCIIAAPVFSLTPNSLLLAFRDRVFGPKMDIVAPQLGMPEAEWVRGRFKSRPGGLISVGGALSEHWTSLGLPTMYTACFSAQTHIVDHVNVYGIADRGAATLQEKWLEKARKLGENVADAMLSGDDKWRGDEGRVCPYCHLDMLILKPGTDKVTCPVCGVSGTISVKDGVATVDWPEDEQNRLDNRQTPQGIITHQLEIRHCRETTYAPYEKEAIENLKKYEARKDFVLMPPSRQKKLNKG